MPAHGDRAATRRCRPAGVEPRSDQRNQERNDQVELLLDANAPEHAQPVGRDRTDQAIDQLPRKSQKRKEMDSEHRQIAGRPEVWLEHGKQDEEPDHDDQVIERPDPQDAPDPECAEGDAAIAGLFAQQERRDQVAAQDEEELDAVSAVFLKAWPAVTPISRDEHVPGNAAVEQINQQEGDEPHAVELGKVDALGRLGSVRAALDSGWYGRGLGSFDSGRWKPLRATGPGALGGPGEDARDQPLGQVGAGPERLGLAAGPDQVDRVPARAQGLQVVGDGQIGAVGQAGDRRRGGSALPAATRDSSLNPTR